MYLLCCWRVDMWYFVCLFFFSSRRRHTRYWRDWSSDVCSSDLDHEVLDLVALAMPQTSFTTQALWYEIPPAMLGDAPLMALLGALHAAEHAQIAVLPLLAMCDRWDIGGLSTNLHPQTGGPTIFIYDGHPGGIGITRRGFPAFDALVDDAHRLIGECGCEQGCPSCVQSPKCGNLNEPLSKDGAFGLMGRMLAAG